MIKIILQSLLGKIGFQIVRTGSVNKKYGPTPGYYRLDKLPPLSTVVDVGVGHQGSPFLYTRFSEANFISIDPLHEAEQAVQKRLGSSKGHFIQAAVGTKRQLIEFQVSETPSRTSLFERTQHDHNSLPMETRQAQMDCLDSLLQGIEIKRPALLKVDIEGGELDCLQGGKETVDAVDYIILELQLTRNFRGSYRFSEVIAFMAQRQFEPFQVLKAGNNTIELLFSQADDPIRETWAYGTTEE